MRILLLHNKYKIKGGEDSVLENERKLLENNGHYVSCYSEDNAKVRGKLQELVIALFSFFNPISFFKLKKKISTFKPDIIHVHNFFPIISPSVFWAAKKMKTPIVMTLHNFRLICPNALLFRNYKSCEICICSNFKLSAIKYKCYRNSYMQSFIVWAMSSINTSIGTWKNKVQYFIPLTAFSKEKFVNSSINVPSSHFIIKPNFVDDPGENNSERSSDYLFLGRLSEEKGIKVLIESMEYLNSSKKIIVVGTGPLEESVKKAAEKFDNFIYLGFKKHSECIQLLKSCSALVFPSLWYEGFPMTILESFSTGTPVITSDIGNQKVIVEDGVNGIHFCNDNPKDLAEKINNFSIKKDKNLFKNARKTYLNKYTPQKNYEELMSIYNSLIRKKDD